MPAFASTSSQVDHLRDTEKQNAAGVSRRRSPQRDFSARLRTVKATSAGGRVSPAPLLPSLPMTTAGAVRLCIQCHQEVDLRPDRYARCSGCRERKRRHEQKRRATGVIEVRATVPPDPAPAIDLRLELQRHRAEDRPFEMAWNDALRVILARIRSVHERQLWAGALWATRPSWEAGYSRRGPQTMAALDDQDQAGTRTDVLLLG
jgi:hypothetical protein